MIEDDIVLSYGKDEELPEITIRKKTKIKKNKTSNTMVTMLIEEGKRVSWVYLLSLIIYFSAVALELYFFLSQDPEIMSTSYMGYYYEEMDYRSYIIRNLFTIKSVYIGLGIMLILAAIISVMLWHAGRTRDSKKYKTSFSEIKERRTLYIIRFFIAFLGYLSIIGGYFVALYAINFLATNNLEINSSIHYNFLYMGGLFALPAVYLNRYVITAGVLAIISLLFLAAIAKIYKSYKIVISTILLFPVLGGIGFLLYKNNFLYYAEKRLILTVIFLVFFLGAVFLTNKVSDKNSMKGVDKI
ncbi:hypothetical protein ACPWSR_02615 [Alloiococcus sp. CFN-8]|uniref:hypothetical protein n=1 Tax=Alloiococcus sp. CFN-8 TaxID=3416081 RepID=UPI003CE6DC6C